MAIPSPDVLRAIAAERGQPYEAVAAEFGALPPAVSAMGGMPAPAPAPMPLPVMAPPVVAEPVPAPVQAPPPAAQVENNEVDLPDNSTPAPTLAPAGDTGTAVDELDQLTDTQADAAIEIGEAEAKSAEREVAMRDEWSREADEIAKKYDEPEAAAAEMQRLSMERIRKLNAEIEASPEIRDRRTSGQKVWGAIGLLLAGWSEGVSGGKNNAVAQVAGMMSEAAERDIAIQRANRDNKRRDAEAAQSEWGLARQYLGDTREARGFAVAKRKERFADDIGLEAAKLTSVTARARATQAAAQYKVEAKKEQLDLLKRAMGNQMSAMEAAMMVRLGVLSPSEAKARMGGTPGDAGATPSDAVPGNLTKTQQGAVNVATYQNDVPGLTWLVDPSKVSKEDREAAQKIKSGSDRAVATTRKARAAYEIAADTSRSDEDRLSALNRYRTLTNVQLPGYVSQATGSGTPQEAEAQRLLASLPPAPVVNDVAGMRAFMQRASNWRNDVTMDPRAFDYFAEDFGDIVDSGLEAYKARRGTAPAPAPAPSAAGSDKPKAKPKAASKPKAAVATSPEDFD